MYPNVADMRRDIHGIPVGDAHGQFLCDVAETHVQNRVIEHHSRVQYECIRVDDPPWLRYWEVVPREWLPDMARCADCERAELGQPTRGYEEALVEVDIAGSGTAMRLDASDLRLIDYSPAGEGIDLTVVPAALVKTATDAGDFGYIRVSRIQRQIASFAVQGFDEIADEYTAYLEWMTRAMESE